MLITILGEEEIRECVNLSEDVIDVITEGFSKLPLVQAAIPPMIRVEIPENMGEVGVITAQKIDLRIYLPDSIDVPNSIVSLPLF